MEIRYSLTEEDVLAYVDYRLRSSEPLRRSIQMRRLVYLVAFLILAAGTWMVTQQKALPLAFALLGVLFAILMPMTYRTRLRRRVLQTYSQKEHRATLGERTLRLGPEGLETGSESGEDRVRWADINEIVTTSMHAFIFVQDSPPFVIPRARIISGDYDAFFQECERYYQQAADQAGPAEGEQPTEQEKSTPEA